VLEDGAKVERVLGNPLRGAWVSARIWVKDAETASKALSVDIAGANT
jgi:hypothetical protein